MRTGAGASTRTLSPWGRRRVGQQLDRRPAACRADRGSPTSAPIRPGSRTPGLDQRTDAGEKVVELIVAEVVGDVVELRPVVELCVEPACRARTETAIPVTADCQASANASASSRVTSSRAIVPRQSGASPGRRSQLADDQCQQLLVPVGVIILRCSAWWCRTRVAPAQCARCAGAICPTRRSARGGCGSLPAAP
jgi:hypothetical protein